MELKLDLELHPRTGFLRKSYPRTRERLRENRFIDAMWKEAERHGLGVEPVERMINDSRRTCSRALFRINGMTVRLHCLSKPQTSRGNAYGKTRFEYPSMLGADFHLVAMLMEGREPVFYVVPTEAIMERVFQNRTERRSVAAYFPVAIGAHWRSGVGKLHCGRYFNNWELLKQGL